MHGPVKDNLSKGRDSKAHVKQRMLEGNEHRLFQGYRYVGKPRKRNESEFALVFLLQYFLRILLLQPRC